MRLIEKPPDIHTNESRIVDRLKVRILPTRKGLFDSRLVLCGPLVGFGAL